MEDLQKNQSVEPQKSIEFCKVEEVMTKLIPRAIVEAKELLCIDDEDAIIQIMRFFDWNMTKI